MTAARRWLACASSPDSPGLSVSFTRLIETVRGYQAELSPARARQATARLADGLTVTLDLMALPGVTVDADRLWAAATANKPFTEEDVSRLLRWPKRPAPPVRKPKRRGSPTPAGHRCRPVGAGVRNCGRIATRAAAISKTGEGRTAEGRGTGP